MFKFGRQNESAGISKQKILKKIEPFPWAYAEISRRLPPKKALACFLDAPGVED